MALAIMLVSFFIQGDEMAAGSGANGVYWIGTDGNVWVKGSRGTNSAGAYDRNSDAYWSNLGFSKIVDPNPQGITQGLYTTSGYGLGGVGGSGSASATPEQIANNYQPLFGFYDKQLGNLSNRQQQNQSQITGQYNTQKQNLQTQTNQSKQNVQTNQSNALRDLENNLRQAFQAGQIRLGNAGAGDSSAVGQYSYALTRLSNENRGDIQRQSNQLNTEIDNTMTNALGQLDLWKQQQYDSIANQYQQLRDQLEEKKAGLTAQQRADITNAQVSLAQNALQALQGTQGTYDNLYNQWVANQQGAIDIGSQSSQSLLNTGNASAGLRNYSTLNNTQPTIQRNSGYSSLPPIFQVQKRDPQSYLVGG